MSSRYIFRRRRRLPRLGVVVATLAAAALIALLAYGLLSQGSGARVDEGLSVGRAVAPPPLSLPPLSGGRPGSVLRDTWRAAVRDDRVELRELRGHPIVVNFWASWCPPCRDEAPLLERSWRRQRDAGVLFLGVDQADNADDARAFLARYGVDYPNVKEAGDEASRRWGLTGYPETFFLSRNGKIVAHVIGVVRAQQLEAGVEAAQRGTVEGARRGGEQRGRP